MRTVRNRPAPTAGGARASVVAAGVGAAVRTTTQVRLDLLDLGEIVATAADHIGILQGKPVSPLPAGR